MATVLYTNRQWGWHCLFVCLGDAKQALKLEKSLSYFIQESRTLNIVITLRKTMPLLRWLVHLKRLDIMYISSFFFLVRSLCSSTASEWQAGESALACDIRTSHHEVLFQREETTGRIGTVLWVTEIIWLRFLEKLLFVQRKIQRL